jgi:hypothetical protein
VHNLFHSDVAHQRAAWSHAIHRLFI